MKNVLSILALAGIAASAQAQTGAWTLLGAATGDGDSIIEESLGETSATFKFAIDLTPNPGQTLGDGSTVVGFGSVIANFIGDANWQGGNVTWSMNPNLIFLTGDLTQKGGTGYGPQDLHDMNAGQIPGFGPFSSADPIDVITINWDLAGSGYSQRDVTFSADTQDGDTIQVYIKKPGGSFEEPMTWSQPDLSSTFSNEPIPAPGSLALLGLGGLAAVRRRR